jgi:integrase
VKAGKSIYGENSPYFKDYDAAISKSVKVQKALADNKNPLKQDHSEIETLDNLVERFLSITTHKYEKKKQIYKDDIKPVLGDKLLGEITRYDMGKLLVSIVNQDRKSIARRTLYFLRSVFSYASDHKLILENVTSNLTVEKNAGGDPQERQIFLSESEIEKTFDVLNQYPKQAPLTNKIAIVLYLIFGFRKSELLSSQWRDFNFEKKEWSVRPTKKGEEMITLDIPDDVMPYFYTLRALNIKGSEFMFPTKRDSKSGHLSESTLNNMLAKFFTKYSTNTVNFNNPLGNDRVRKFWIHDLRRTFTSTANDNEIAEEVTLRCLNHKKRKRLKIYDLSNRRAQRKVVYELMAGIVLPLVCLESEIQLIIEEVKVA